MDINSNTYTFSFAAILVAIVAVILSVAAMALKPKQDENIRLEKMQNILASVKIDVDRSEAEEIYHKTIVESFVMDHTGKKLECVDEKGDKVLCNAFDVELEKEVAKAHKERKLPVYIAELEGSTYTIIPMRGKGLWGPIWGFISIREDMESIYGSFFDHKSETPGLGAEITTDEFETQFEDKKLFKEANFVSIDVVKGSASTEYQVDGISGGTVTSNGVEDMIKDCIAPYESYLKSKKPTPASIQEVEPSTDVSSSK